MYARFIWHTMQPMGKPSTAQNDDQERARVSGIIDVNFRSPSFVMSSFMRPPIHPVLPPKMRTLVIGFGSLMIAEEKYREVRYDEQRQQCNN